MARTTLVSAAVGGLVGAAVSAAIFYSAGPQLMGERLVRTSLLEHPEIILEAGDVLRDRQYAPLIEANREVIETPFEGAVQGASAEDADVVMVEFYDYACGYCRQTKPDVDRLIEEDDKLRVVYRELPVLGPDSVIAARASLAAAKAGKFAQFHDYLYDAGSPNEETITAALAEVGLTLEDAKDPAFEAELQKNFEIANALGANGTPVFIIGNRVINSADGYQAYKDAIEAARRAKDA
ncbi:DsbA family protein [Sphingomicrobium aestuariivivum]|uniref:DsbA family protein n=1 Tax=Sphingomicrobium aestuariivivum TaxID=1582356 RepID=UPI001FD6DF6E|nr:thioredoxin domain-containing protein [Sphingomicrobium aestuariivivum]MCJ8190518.1 thioredoxin domain-containing protein [Sphingomicrobium aestuariivivum]